VFSSFFPSYLFSLCLTVYIYLHYFVVNHFFLYFFCVYLSTVLLSLLCSTFGLSFLFFIIFFSPLSWIFSRLFNKFVFLPGLFLYYHIPFSPFWLAIKNVEIKLIYHTVARFLTKTHHGCLFTSNITKLADTTQNGPFPIASTPTLLIPFLLLLNSVLIYLATSLAFTFMFLASRENGLLLVGSILSPRLTWSS
jgi:hypothetical protein